MNKVSLIPININGLEKRQGEEKGKAKEHVDEGQKEEWRINIIIYPLTARVDGAP